MQYHGLFPSVPNAERLKAGDTEQSITILYGTWDDPFLVFSTENDCVDTLELRKNYYTAG